MIFGKICHYHSYRGDEKLNKVLSYMAGITPDTFPQEQIKLDGDSVFVNPVCFTTKPESECLYEAHRRYADIHFIVEGCEKIIVSDISAVVEHTSYSDEKDIGFYTCESGAVVVLHPGDFLVCYPQDAHKVAIAPDSPAPVKKLVGKIRV